MENFTFQALQAYNHWYPPSRVVARTVGTLPCGHKGIMGAPMCKTCADALISQALGDERQYAFINDLIDSYTKQNSTNSSASDTASSISFPLPSFAEAFLSHLGDTNYSEGTQSVYAGVLALFFAFLSSDPANYTLEEFSQVKVQRLEEFFSYCRKKRKNEPASLAHKQSTIKSLYRYLNRIDLLPVDITEKLDTLYVQEKLPKALTPEEVTRLAQELSSGTRYKWTRERDRAIVFTLIGTGLRVSELCNLNLVDIDFVRGLLHIINKRGGEEYVSFGEDIELALRAYIEHERPRYESKKHSPSLFLSMRGTRISVDAVQVLVVNALESIGIYGFNTERLRSTAAALLIRETGDLDLVQGFMRHKDPKTTSRYSTLLQDELKRVANQIHIK